MSTKPAFRTIAEPLTVSDTELNRLNQQMGVPTMVEGTPQSVQKSTTKPQRPINILVPDYVAKAVRDRAHLKECSIRCVILKALANDGIEVDAADLVADARKGRS